MRATTIDLSNPVWIGQRNDVISIGFSCGDGSDLVLEGVLENDTIVVKRYMRFIACG